MQERFHFGIQAMTQRIGGQAGYLLSLPSSADAPAVEQAELVAAWPTLPPSSPSPPSSSDQPNSPAPLPPRVELAIQYLQQNGYPATSTLLAVKPTSSGSGETQERYLILAPCRLPDPAYHSSHGLGVFELVGQAASVCQQRMLRMEALEPLLAWSMAQSQASAAQHQVDQLGQAIRHLADVSAMSRFTMAAMGWCNGLAAQYQATRVSLGWVKRRQIQVVAMSHVEKIQAQSRQTRLIAMAMEEALDQDDELVWPPLKDTTNVLRQTQALAQASEPIAILSVPLRWQEKVVGVLTLERTAERPWTAAEIQALALSLELGTPSLAVLKEHDRWIGVKVIDSIKRLLAIAVGPKHTWAKATAIGIALLLLALGLIRKPEPIDAAMTIRPTIRRVIPSPFEGYLQAVDVDPGQQVKTGQVLLKLDDAEIRLKRASAMAEKVTHLKQAAQAQRDGKTAEAQAAQAQADKAQAEIDLMDYRLSQALVIAPIDGVVLPPTQTGEQSHQPLTDLKHRLGAPVQAGQVLLEVAPLQGLEAELHIPETSIANVRCGQQGELAPTADPSRHLRIEVTQVTPMAQVIDQQNIYRVRVKLLDPTDGLMPGMEGVARLDGPRRSLGWIWTKELIYWVRMKLWL